MKFAKLKCMKKTLTQFIITLILFITLFAIPNQLIAAPTPTPSAAPGASQSNPLGQFGCGAEEIYTAIGCIPINYTDMVNFFLTWAIGIAGGIAFLFIIYSGFIILTSSGNPDRIKAGQELLTSAIMGLILIIFSVFILRVVGVDVFGIPGWTK
jgi:hypothetical protein